MSLRGVEGDRVRGEIRRVTADLHHGVVLPRHHVGVGDHLARAAHPAGPLDAEPARGAEHPHDARRGGAHGGLARDRRKRRADVGRGAGDGGQRIQARQRVEDRPRGRQHPVELAEDQRALDVAAQLGLTGRLRGHRRGDPHQPQADARAQHRAEGAVDHAKPGQPQRAAQAQAEPLQAGGQERTRQQRAHQSERRGVGGGRAGGRISGPSRVPMNAPTAKPANESAPVMKPWRKPYSAMRPAKATISQSSPVMSASVLPK